MTAARTRTSALVIIIFALTSILWGSTAAHATDGLSISGTIYLGSQSTPATAADVEVEYTAVGTTHVAADVVPVAADGTWTIQNLSSNSYLIYYHYIGAGSYVSKYQSEQSALTYPFSDSAITLADTSVSGLADILDVSATVMGHVTLGSSAVAASANEVSVTASVYAGNSGVTAVYTSLPAVQTNASGNYTISGLAPGDHWRLLFTYEGAGGFESVYDGQVMNDDGQEFSLASGGTVTKDQTLPHLESISGHVYLGTTATPANAGDVTLQLRTYDGGVASTDPIQTATTTSGGAYSFTGLDNRLYQVTPVYVGPGAYSDGTPADISSTTTTADFTVSATGAATYALTGHVDIGTVGNSAQANEIYVGLLTANQETLVTTTLTDANGNYSFPGLVEGDYHIVFSNYAHPNQDYWGIYALAPVGPGETAPDVTIPTYTVSGHVNLVAGTSASIGDVRVVASNTAGFSASASTDTSGNYSFTLPEGTWTLGFRFSGDTANDGATVTANTASDIRNTMNSNITVPDHTMSAYDWISGTVSLPSGAAPVAVTIYADEYDANGDYVETFTRSLSSGAGAYNFTKLPLGTYDVSFVPADGSSVAPQSYEDQGIYYQPTDLVGTPAGGSVFKNINASLHAGGAVTGSALGAPDYSGDDVQVEVKVFDESTSSFVGTGDVYPVAADGSYSITGLLPSQYVIEASYSGPGGDITVDSAPVEVAASQTTLLDILFAPPSVPRGTVSFLRALYHDFLNREPAQSEIGGWATALQNGLQRGDVSSGFVNSDEYRLIRIDAAYEEILNRSAEDAGRMSWLNGMKRGVLTTDDIERALYASDEFFNSQGGTNGDFVQALYTDILHRSASDSEWQGWAAQLDARTLSRAGLISIFWRSLETARDRVGVMFTTYFGRTASQDERVYWGDFILKYGDSAVRSALTGSQEYYNHAQDVYSPSSSSAS